MPKTHDFRILIRTTNGREYSYISSSFVNRTIDTNMILSASQVWHRITGSVSCSFQNSSNFSASADRYATDFNFNSNLFLSSSLSGSLESGSISFHDNGITGSDRFLEMKFFGNKVCNVLGIPENVWLRRNRMDVSPGRNNYFEGDVKADTLTVKNTFNVSNVGSVSSDFPFRLNKNEDRWIKYIFTSR